MLNSIAEVIRKYKILYYPAHVINLYLCAARIIFRQIKYSLIYKVRCVGYKDKRFNSFRALKNKYQGKRCFIICTGPSLRASDLDRLGSEISFSMNSIFKIFSDTQWRPTYYSILDPLVYNAISQDERFINIDNALIPDILVDRYKELTLKHYMQYPLDNNGLHWHRWFGAPIKFSDKADIMVYDVATVTYSLMQIAVYMGFKEIYLLGCDCNYSGEKQHFSEYGSRVRDSTKVEDNLILAFTAARKYADSHGIKIYNATRGGKLEVFERVDFDSLFYIKDEK